MDRILKLGCLQYNFNFPSTSHALNFAQLVLLCVSPCDSSVSKGRKWFGGTDIEQLCVYHFDFLMTRLPLYLKVTDRHTSYSRAWFTCFKSTIVGFLLQQSFLCSLLLQWYNYHLAICGVNNLNSSQGNTYVQYTLDTSFTRKHA